MLDTKPGVVYIKASLKFLRGDIEQMRTAAGAPRSESIQMYLVEIARLSKQGQPVPLSQLAATLRVSPISVNQMCHKLQKEGLVTYVPYKGVSITPSGEGLAMRILRHHRLWEVFLVERLQMSWDEAHETACRLEHDTSDEVIERLARFLGYPRVNPRGEPIPSGTGTAEEAATMPLADMQAGQAGTWAKCICDETSRNFLAGAGLRPGAKFRVMGVEPERILLEVDGQNVVLSHALAATAQAIPHKPLSRQ